MATIKEILEIEDSNGGSIHLHKEGVFWKAYQKSAYQVHRREPEFRVKFTFVKVVNSEVASLGFPDATLNRLFKPEEIEKVNEKTVRIACDAVSDDDYSAWVVATKRQQLAQNVAAQRAAATAAGSHPEDRSTAEKVVLQRLRGFRVEDATPIDCMVFLSTLRKELTAHGDI